MERVVVYGLLRRGQALAAHMAAATFVGEVELSGFDLYHLGNYPGAVPGEGTIRGEVYEIESLDRLDRAERVDDDPPLYRRVQTEALGAPVWIYLYARPLIDSFPIESGDWANPY